jgi:hypothetical protein
MVTVSLLLSEARNPLEALASRMREMLIEAKRKDGAERSVH